MPTLRIDANTNPEAFKAFVESANKDHQLRATEIKDNKGNLVGYNLYTKKSDSWLGSGANRGIKYENARKAVNLMLEKSDRKNLLAVNDKKMDGLQLHGMMNKDVLVVNKNTTLDQLSTLGARIGDGKQMRGRHNADGTITLYGSSSTRTGGDERKNKFTAVNTAVANVIHNASRGHAAVYNNMLGAYESKLPEETRGSSALPTESKNFMRAAREARTKGYEKPIQEAAKKLSPQLDGLQNELFNRQDLGDVIAKNDPMRTKLTKAPDSYGNLADIQDGKTQEIGTLGLIDSVKKVAQNTPVIPLDKLAVLANSDNVASAVGCYTGNNTMGNRTVQDVPDQNAALLLRNEIRNLSAQERAQLKSRVDLLANMARLYDTHQGEIKGDGADNEARWTKALTVSYQTTTGYDIQKLNRAVGGNPREAGIKIRDLMTALVIHKDIVFPPEQ